MSGYEIASDILVGLSAAAVAGMAGYGVTTWRREMSGRAKFELSRRLMVLFRKVQGGFRTAIFPITSSVEYADRPPLVGESYETAAVLNEYWAKWRRLMPLIEPLSELHELTWESEVVLGAVASNRVCEAEKLLRKKYAHLTVAMQSYFELLRDQAEGVSVAISEGYIRRLRDEVSPLEQDQFYKEIEETVDELAFLLRKESRSRE